MVSLTRSGLSDTVVCLHALCTWVAERLAHCHGLSRPQNKRITVTKTKLKVCECVCVRAVCVCVCVCVCMHMCEECQYEVNTHACRKPRTGVKYI